MTELEKKHEELVMAFRRKDPEFDPDFKEHISYPDIKALVNDSATVLVEIFPMRDKTVIFIIKGVGKLDENTLVIEDYNLSNLRNHISELSEKYTAYQEEKSSQRGKALKEWKDCLENILKDLYVKLFKKIRPFLEGVKEIIMVPYSGFHLLPLHAMFTEENGPRSYIIDDYLVTYAPSAKILKHCRERERNKKENVVVAFANPEGTGMLHFASEEVKAINKLFEGSHYIERARRKDILKQGKKSNILHYAGHANFNSLFLHNEEGGKEEFRVDDIFMSLDLPNAYMSTLSACETGITRVGRVDEYIGLPSAFLYAGAPTVISSLWSVNDASTGLLMRKMYELIKERKMGKAEALITAQRWLKNPENVEEHLKMLLEMRSETEDIQWIGAESPAPSVAPDFSSPYYWAGFICSGVD